MTQSDEGMTESIHHFQVADVSSILTNEADVPDPLATDVAERIVRYLSKPSSTVEASVNPNVGKGLRDESIEDAPNRLRWFQCKATRTFVHGEVLPCYFVSGHAGTHSFEPNARFYANADIFEGEPREDWRGPDGWATDEPPTDAKARALLGQQVRVLIGTGGPEGRTIVEGKLLSFSNGGEFTVQDDDGFVHYCWPLLDIEPADDTSHDPCSQCGKPATENVGGPFFCDECIADNESQLAGYTTEQLIELTSTYEEQKAWDRGESTDDVTDDPQENADSLVAPAEDVRELASPHPTNAEEVRVSLRKWVAHTFPTGGYWLGDPPDHDRITDDLMAVMLGSGGSAPPDHECTVAEAQIAVLERHLNEARRSLRNVMKLARYGNDIYNEAVRGLKRSTDTEETDTR